MNLRTALWGCLVECCNFQLGNWGHRNPEDHIVNDKINSQTQIFWLQLPSIKWALLWLKTTSSQNLYLKWRTRCLSFEHVPAFLFHLLSFFPFSLCFINIELLTALHRPNAPFSLMPSCELFLQLGYFCSFLNLTNYILPNPAQIWPLWILLWLSLLCALIFCIHFYNCTYFMGLGSKLTEQKGQGFGARQT